MPFNYGFMNGIGNKISKRLSFSAFLIIGMIVTVNAQSISGWDSRENMYSNNVRTFDNRYEGVEGSPFLNTEWHAGTIEMKNGKRIQVDLLNFDVYQQEVVLEKENGAKVAPSKQHIESFTIQKNGTDSLLFEKGAGGDFYQVLYADGENRLLKEYEKEFLKADFKGAYASNRTADKFITKESFILESPEGTNSINKLSKRNLKKLFKGINFDPLGFLKKNDLDISEASLVKLVAAYANGKRN